MNARGARWLPVVFVPWPFVLVALAFLAPGRIACGNATGYGPALLEIISACGPATDRLGAPLEFDPLRGGFGGNYMSGQEGGEGFTYGDLVVRGPKGRARVDYQLQKALGVWSPSVLRLTFEDDSRLDVKACAADAILKRGQGAMLATFERLCAEGQADQCLALAQVKGALGDVEGAAKARQQACALGLKPACPAP